MPDEYEYLFARGLKFVAKDLDININEYWNEPIQFIKAIRTKINELKGKKDA